MRKIIATLFFLSGITGLIYQLLWVRKFTYLLGSAYLTVSIVVASFMAGLLVGAWLAGKFMERTKNPVRWYGILESFIGLYAFLFVLLFNVFNMLFGSIYAALSESDFLRVAITALLIFIILLPPTAAMGATLPLLVQHFSKKLSDFKINISLFYAINTLGGAAGVLTAGFFLIEYTGITNGILLTGAFNLLIGITALMMSMQKEMMGDPPSTSPDKIAESGFGSEGNGTGRPSRKSRKRLFFKMQREHALANRRNRNVISKTRQTLLLITACISGFSALSYEIIWTRALKFLIQSSTYSFAIMLFVFLLGIAIGGRIAERMMKEKTNLLYRYGQLQLLLSLTTLFTIYFLYQLAYTSFFQAKFFDVIFNYSTGWFSGILIYVFTCGIVFLPSTILMGILFPMLNQLYHATQTGIPGKSVSRIYTINTAGAIAGSLLAGFILIPLLGIKWSILLLSAVNLIVGLMLVTRLKERTVTTGTAGISIFLLMLIISPRGNFLNSKEELNSDRVLYYNEGLSATVKVYESKNSLNLSIDGMNIASTAPALLQKELLLAHLPFFIHPEIHDVLSVGLASGISTGSIAEYTTVRKVDCVELIKPVFHASTFFATENHDVMNNPKVHLFNNDIFAFLKFNSSTYDLISSDGKLGTLDNANTTMLSADYYEQCKKRLNPGGLFIQWIPLITPSSCFKVILQTLKKSFSHVSLFYFYPSDVFMIASDTPIVLDLQKMQRTMQKEYVNRDVSALGFNKASEIMCSYIGNYEKQNDEFRINTMDQPLLEFWFYRDWKKADEATGGYRTQNLTFLLNNFRAEQSTALETYRGLPNPAWARGIFSSSENFLNFCVMNFTNGSYEAGKKEFDEFKKSIPF